MASDDSQTTDPVSEQLGFEDAFRQLAEIAETLEAGGLTLAEATARYEQGMKLVQHCNRLLDTAELEITSLRENYQRPAGDGRQQNGMEPPVFDDADYEDIVEEEEELPF